MVCYKKRSGRSRYFTPLSFDLHYPHAARKPVSTPSAPEPNRQHEDQHAPRSVTGGIDGKGRVVLIGQTPGPLDFGDGPLGDGGQQCFVAKLGP